MKTFDNLTDEEKEFFNEFYEKEYKAYGVTGKPKEFQLGFEKGMKEAYVNTVGHYSELFEDYNKATSGFSLVALKMISVNENLTNIIKIKQKEINTMSVIMIVLAFILGGVVFLPR